MQLLTLHREAAVSMLLDVEHVFRDWKNAEGRCRVRIFAGTDASGQLPAVLTEPNDNDGSSVTNTVEQIAPEVLLRYLPQQDGLAPAFVLIEHHPDRQPLGNEGRWHDPFFSETFDLVSFERWSLRPSRGAYQHVLYTLGTPDWRRTDRTWVQELIGEELPWLACTCRTTHNSGGNCNEGRGDVEPE